jgi:hypothetical protein
VKASRSCERSPCGPNSLHALCDSATVPVAHLGVVGRLHRGRQLACVVDSSLRVCHVCGGSHDMRAARCCSTACREPYYSLPLEHGDRHVEQRAHARRLALPPNTPLARKGWRTWCDQGAVTRVGVGGMLKAAQACVVCLCAVSRTTAGGGLRVHHPKLCAAPPGLSTGAPASLVASKALAPGPVDH